MRPSSLFVVATLVFMILVGRAAAGPPPTKKNHTSPTGGAVVGGGLALLGTTFLVLSAMPDRCDDCHLRKAPFFIGASMMFFGPTLGRLPAHDIGAFHLGVRVGGAAFLALSFKLEHEGAERGAQSLALLGVAMIVGGVISDVATTPAAHRRWNERHALGIVPATVTPSGLAPGLSLTGRF
jgi:hypothetical protein